MATTFTVKCHSLGSLLPQKKDIEDLFKVEIKVQEKTEDSMLSWISIKGSRQKEAKNYITTICDSECTQVLVCPPHFGEYLEDARRRLEENFKIVCRLLDGNSMEVCGSNLDVTLAASAFEEIINQFDDNVAKDPNNKNYEEILDSHLCSFAQNDEWQGLETSINMPAHVKRALLSVLSEEPLEDKEKVTSGTCPATDTKTSELGVIEHSIKSESDSSLDSTVVGSTAKKKPISSTCHSRIAARFPDQDNQFDGSFIDDQQSVIFMGMKPPPNLQLDETIIQGNVTMSPKMKKIRLDTIDNIDIGPLPNDRPDPQQTLVNVLLSVGYELWAIEAAQATLPKSDQTDHKKVLSILQNQKNKNKFESLTLPSEKHKTKKHNFSKIVPPSTPSATSQSQDLSVYSVEELERKHQELHSIVNSRKTKNLFTPMKLQDFGSPSLAQSTPLVKPNSEFIFSSDDESEVTVINKYGRNELDSHPKTDVMEGHGELKSGFKSAKPEMKPSTQDFVYISSSSGSESSGENGQKIKMKSEKSFVNAIESELAARQESNLQSQKAEFEEGMRKQQDDIMKELEKRYEEQKNQLRLQNERIQKQQEESIKEMRLMMEKQNKEHLKQMMEKQSKELLEKEKAKRKQKDKEIRDLEEQNKRMQQALNKHEETMKQLQKQQQSLAKVKTQHLPEASPIRIEPKISEASSGLRPIVVDGSNVAMSHGKNKVFSCRGIALCVKYFQDRGHKEITVFLPHWRKTSEGNRMDKPITDRHILDDLERKEILHFTPSRKVNGRFISSYDDRFIIRLASMNDGVIVSNDNYRDLLNESQKWKKVIEERLLMYNIVGDIFLVPDDPLGRNGPSLNEFLRKQPLNSNDPADAASTILSVQSRLPTQNAQQLLAFPPQITRNQPIHWNPQTRNQHFPELTSPFHGSVQHNANFNNDGWPFMDSGRRQVVNPMPRPVRARTENYRHLRPPDIHERSERVLRRENERETQPSKRGNNDMEELTRVFEKLATIFPNQEEKIMTVLHQYPNIKDVKKYEHMIRNPGTAVPQEKFKDVRKLPMFTQLKNVFPDADEDIVKLLTKYPDVDDMNALCAMLLE